MKKPKLSLLVLGERWIKRDPPLLPSTVASYTKEIDGLANFVETQLGGKFHRLTQDAWAEYLGCLESAPLEGMQRRRKALNSSSQDQAFRITRSFLIWAWEQGAISWRPTGQNISRKAPQTGPSELKPMPESLLAALAGNKHGQSFSEMRALLALNLGFWATLSPRHMSLLGRDDLIGQHSHSISRTWDERSDSILVPKHLGSIWRRYLKLRDERFGLSTNNSLFTQQDHDEPASAWSIWQAIRAYQLSVLGVDYVPGHAMRRHYIARALDTLSPRGSAILDHAGVQRHTMLSSRGRGIAHQNEDRSYRDLIMGMLDGITELSARDLGGNGQHDGVQHLARA